MPGRSKGRAEKYEVEKDSSEPEMRAKADHENVTHSPEIQKKKGKGVLDLEGSQRWKLY